MTQQKPVALKEWAVAVQALEEGKQVIILRKGGIAEETADFELESESFYFFPTYEHQKKALVKEAYHSDVDRTMEIWQAERQEVTISCYAEAVVSFQVTDQEELDRLRHLHIWTDTFATERLHWKRQKPLHVIVLRAYKLQPVKAIPILADYAGCKSWIFLETPLMLTESDKQSVLSDEQFEARLNEVRLALGR